MKTKEVLLDKFFEEVDGRVKFKEGKGLGDLAEFIDKEKSDIEDSAREGEHKTIEYILKELFGINFKIFRWLTPKGQNDIGMVNYSDSYDASKMWQYSKQAGTWSFLNNLKKEYFKKAKL